MDDQLRAAALEYHRQPCAGKILVTPTKELVNQHDLALAYSPGVAAACDAIVADPREAQERRVCSRNSRVSTYSTSRLRRPTLTCWSTRSLDSNPLSAASISKTSRRRNASTSRRSCASGCGFQFSTMISTVLRSSLAPQSRTHCGSSPRMLAKSAWFAQRRGAAAIACLDLLVALGLKHENVVVCETHLRQFGFETAAISASYDAGDCVVTRGRGCGRWRYGFSRCARLAVARPRTPEIPCRWFCAPQLLAPSLFPSYPRGENHALALTIAIEYSLCKPPNTDFASTSAPAANRCRIWELGTGAAARGGPGTPGPSLLCGLPRL